MKQFFITFLILISSEVYSQVAVSYFPFQSVFAVSSNPDNLIWVDVSTGTNTFFSNIDFEGSALINIKKTEVFNYYTGLAISMNPFYRIEGLTLTNGYAFKLGTRIKPFRENRNIHLVFELSPYLNRYLDGGLLRTMLGISYNFDIKKITGT